jgi:DNA-directed RNA polymerase subunit beta
MFFNFDRYDLGRVGVYKFNTKFDLGYKNEDFDKKENRVLSPEKLLAVLKEVVRLNVTQEEPDDIDHLGNRRVFALWVNWLRTDSVLVWLVWSVS